MSTSVLRVEISINLSLITSTIAKKIPHSFDERGHPESKDYRWDLRHLGDPAVKAVAGGRLNLFQRYYGDLETKKLLGGCHLGSSPGNYDPHKPWVFLDLNVSAKPTVENDRGKWIIRAKDILAEVNLGPGSDTKCMVFDIDVSKKLQTILGSPALRDDIANAVRDLEVLVPLTELWTAANKPGRIPLNLSDSGAAGVCFTLNLSKIEVEELSEKGDLVFLPLSLHIEPAAKFTQGAACEETAHPSQPNIVVH